MKKEQLARLYANHFQRYGHTKDFDWDKTYKFALDNPERLKEFEDYLEDINEAKRDGFLR